MGIEPQGSVANPTARLGASLTTQFKLLSIAPFHRRAVPSPRAWPCPGCWGFNGNSNSHLPHIGRPENTKPATAAPSARCTPDSTDIGQECGANSAPETKFPVQTGSGQESIDTKDAPVGGLEFPGDVTKTSEASTTSASNSHALITSIDNLKWGERAVRSRKLADFPRDFILDGTEYSAPIT